MKKNKICLSIFIFLLFILNFVSTCYADTPPPDLTAGAAILMDNSSRENFIWKKC